MPKGTATIPIKTYLGNSSTFLSSIVCPHLESYEEYLLRVADWPPVKTFSLSQSAGCGLSSCKYARKVIVWNF